MRRGDTSTGAAVLFGARVAHHERGRFEPGHDAQRREVGLQRDVAVALVPARELVAGQHRHVGVDREQVVARVDRHRARAHVVDPVVAGHPLAHQAALQVGEHDEHGVDAPVGDHLVELRRPSACLGPWVEDYADAWRFARPRVRQRDVDLDVADVGGSTCSTIRPSRAADRPFPRECHATTCCSPTTDERPVGFVSGVEETHPDKGTEMFLYELARRLSPPATAASAARSCARSPTSRRARVLRHVRAHRRRQRTRAAAPTTAAAGTIAGRPRDARVELRRATRELTRE